MRWGARVIALVCLVFVVFSSSAQAHFLSSKGQWVFKGSTFKDKNQKERKDPINVFFGGGGVIDSSRVNTHFDDDWDRSRVGGHSWRTHGQMNSNCRDNQYAEWRFNGGDQDHADQHGSTSKTQACTRQHHMRIWDDYEHWKLNPSTHARYDWAIGAIHHEVPFVKRSCTRSLTGVPFCVIRGVSHRPDRDWDVVRKDAVDAMHGHCTKLRWRRNPDARRWYQGYKNSGYLGRISMKHRSSGSCDGA